MRWSFCVAIFVLTMIAPAANGQDVPQIFEGRLSLMSAAVQPTATDFDFEFNTRRRLPAPFDTEGGREQTDRYGAKLDQIMIFDGCSLGLWEGLSVTMHTETSIGETSIFDATGPVAVNTAFLTPGPNEHVTAITNFQIDQQLGGGYIATLGRINTIDLWAALYPKYGKGLDGFMGAPLMIPLNTVPTISTIFNGAGLMKVEERGVEAAVLVLDPVNIPTTSNLSNLFDNGSTIVGFARVFSNFGCLPGSHAILATYATGDFNSLDRNGFSFQPGQGLIVPETSGSWMASYIGQQTLWMDPCDARRSIDLTTTWGFSDPETSPYEWTGNVTVEGYGLISGREDDRTFGIGWYYTGISDELGPAFSAQFRDGEGVELYYSIAVSEWFHITPDLQFVDPNIISTDNAIVPGVRARIDF